MPQVTLVPETTTYPNEGRTPWATFGTAALVLKAVDGHQAIATIPLGTPDTDPMRGITWRIQGSGAVPSWVGRTITNIKLELNINVQSAIGFAYFALVTANEPLSYVETVFNGPITSPQNVQQWFTVLTGLNASIRAAVLANNFLFSIINYNHTQPSLSVVVEAARMVIDYQDPLLTSWIAMEA